MALCTICFPTGLHLVPPRGVCLQVKVCDCVLHMGELTKIVQQWAFTNCQPLFPLYMHRWTGNCNSFGSNLVSGTAPHFQTCLR